MGEDQQKKGKEKATPPRRARSLQSGQTPDGQVHALDDISTQMVMIFMIIFLSQSFSGNIPIQHGV